MLTRSESKRVLAEMSSEQREAVAVFVETSQPWLDLSEDVRQNLSKDDAVCILGIVADGIRLQSECEPPNAVPSFQDGSAWIDSVKTK